MAVLRLILGRYACQHHVIGLRSAGCEDDFIGIGMEQLRKLVTPGKDRLVCLLAGPVQAGRIAKDCAVGWEHRLHDTWVEWGGGRVVKINLFHIYSPR